MQNLLIKKIKNLGSIPFDKFMSLSLLDQDFGYYKIQNPIGSQGDFITSPEISQIFGEIVGSYIAYVWQLLGHPSPFNIIELGAGKGTLLNDILRTTKNISNFHSSLHVSILEVNNNLLKIQKKSLEKFNLDIQWINNINKYDKLGPCFIISNEFFDALPVQQYKIIQNQLHELYISVKHLNSHDTLIFEYIKLDTIPSYLKEIKIKNIYETSFESRELFKKLLDIIKINRGCILTIDYGYTIQEYKNTIRGFYNHKVLNINEILKYAPLCDITYDVNFLSLQDLVEKEKLQIYNILTQRDFLIRCGIRERTKILVNNSNNNQDKFLLATGTDKLINPNIMGNIFKIMACSSLNIDLPIFIKLS